jgi:4'-phosphopantetheinyl transferase
MIYWLEQAVSDVPPGDGWLGQREAERMRGLHFAKRRADWRLGRWTAKRAVAAYLRLPRDPDALAGIEILPAPDGAPEAFLASLPASVVISLTHSQGRAVCAVAPPGTALGCDLEKVEPRSDAFLADYFTDREREMAIRGGVNDGARVATLVWSAKEAALKALRTGLRRDTRSVEVEVCAVSEDGWRRLAVRDAGGGVFQGWWLDDGGFVLTLVAEPPLAAPHRLA